MPFDFHTLFELWLAKNQTLHLETAYYGQRSSSTETEMSDFQTQQWTWNILWNSDCRLRHCPSVALSLTQLPFHGNLRLQIIIITIFRKKTIIILQITKTKTSKFLYPHAFSRPPPDWFEISWCIHSWHPLCPHNKDTGLFISSLLKNRTRFHQQWQVAKKYVNSFYSFRST